MPFSSSEQSRSRSITPERRRGRQLRYGREEYRDLREGRDDRILSVIVELQNNQRQLQERILTLMMDRNTRNLERNEMLPARTSPARIGYLYQPVRTGGEEALAQHLLSEGYSKGWRAPKMTMYEGSTDPEDHIHSFHMGMEDTIRRKDIWCRMFRRTLKGETVGWYRNLPVGSINSFDDLEKAFKIAFGHKIRRKGLNTTLLSVKQGDQESTREYMDRFATAVQKVVCSEEAILMDLAMA